MEKQNESEFDNEYESDSEIRVEKQNESEFDNEYEYESESERRVEKQSECESKDRLRALALTLALFFVPGAGIEPAQPFRATGF